MSPIRLETPRLVLREFLPSDLDAMDVYASDPEVVKYEPWGPNTKEQTEQFLSAVLASQREEPRNTFELAIELKGTGLVGGCGMRILDAPNRTADLGYVLAREHWGKGYAPEAVAAFLEFAFKTLGLHRVWATMDTRNVRSKRVLEKVGMRQEGLRRSHQMLRGEWIDSFLCAVVEDEWRGIRRTLTAPGATVRRATKDDSDSIAALFVFLDALHADARPDLYRSVEGNPRSPEFIDESLGRVDSVVLVVDGTDGLKGLVVAYVRTVEACSVMAARKCVILDALVTHPDHRRTGVGRSLVRAVENWARERGATAVEIGVHEFNREAREFYERLGYTTQTRRLEKRIGGTE
jgi:RimJ/RimL family protein N-acetyltransferase